MLYNSPSQAHYCAIRVLMILGINPHLTSDPILDSTLGLIRVLSHSTSESQLCMPLVKLSLSYLTDLCARIFTPGNLCCSLIGLLKWSQNCAHALISAFIFWSLFLQHLEYGFVPLFALRVVAPSYAMHVMMDFYLWALYICKHLVWHLLWSSFDVLNGIWLPANYWKGLSFHWQSRSCAAEYPLFRISICAGFLSYYHVFWGL